MSLRDELRAWDPSPTATAVAHAFDHSAQGVRHSSETLAAMDRRGTIWNVYFISAVGTDRVKIGYAKNINTRLSELSTSCPFDLEVLLSYPGYLLSEKLAHAHFKAQRIRMNREWFYLRDELAKFAEEWRALP